MTKGSQGHSFNQWKASARLLGSLGRFSHFLIKEKHRAGIPFFFLPLSSCNIRQEIQDYSHLILQHKKYERKTNIIAEILSDILEKAMAPHSSTLAWRIPWTEEPGRLQSMGSLRVRHDWATSLSLVTFMHWRRKWQPTPVFLPRESQGWGSLVGCRLWGRAESDTTEVT